MKFGVCTYHLIPAILPLLWKHIPHNMYSPSNHKSAITLHNISGTENVIICTCILPVNRLLFWLKIKE